MNQEFYAGLVFWALVAFGAIAYSCSIPVPLSR